MSTEDEARPSGSEPSAAVQVFPNLAEALKWVTIPKMGGEEARIGGFWAVLADEYPYSAAHSMWKAELMGIHVQALASPVNGPVYARPFGWTQERTDESRTDYIVGVELVHSDGSSCYWSCQLVPPWTITPSPKAASAASTEGDD
jgi:hypothetical protein